MQGNHLRRWNIRRRFFRVSHDGHKRSAFDVLALAGPEIFELKERFGIFSTIDDDLLSQLQTEAIYDQYAGRQAKEISDLRRQEGQKIPVDFDYSQISGLSNELKQKLARFVPEDMFQASRIEGITPAALVLLLAYLRKADQIRKAV
jgi:tRNA uridine 5-carboxymethylaminomethyl modification enzyme